MGRTSPAYQRALCAEMERIEAERGLGDQELTEPGIQSLYKIHRVPFLVCISQCRRPAQVCASTQMIPQTQTWLLVNQNLNVVVMLSGSGVDPASVHMGRVRSLYNTIKYHR